MQVYKHPAKKEWPSIVARPVLDTHSLEKKVRKILEKVKEKGDKALKKYTEEFNGVELKKIAVTQAEFDAAGLRIEEKLKAAITQARTNIEKFHSAQLESVKEIETMPGITCWRKPVPIEKIGFYIPGGNAPLFSTVLMLGIPAKLAGCKEIVLCTPPGKNGFIDPAILFAASLCGINQVYKVGGVQAIGAMAYGTATVPRVHKILGPGNQYVTCAKQLIQQQGVAIDMPAGPSEVLVIADDSAVPRFVAADLLSQAEHGKDSQVMLLTNSKRVAQGTLHELKEQLDQLPDNTLAAKSIEKSKLVVVKNMEEAIELSNYYAPEHLIIACEHAMEIANKVTAAGSVFIGNYSPESVGDYASGTNHVLPTNGYAAMYSGVSIDSFVKKITFQQLSEEGLRNIADTVMVMAEAEGLYGHQQAVRIRLR
jgi:histidinol dehydrogenase